MLEALKDTDTSKTRAHSKSLWYHLTSVTTPWFLGSVTESTGQATCGHSMQSVFPPAGTSAVSKPLYTQAVCCYAHLPFPESKSHLVC